MKRRLGHINIQRRSFGLSSAAALVTTRWMPAAALFSISADKAQAQAQTESESQPEVEFEERQVRWTMTLHNPLPRELKDQRLWFYAPAQQTASQTLSSLHTSSPCQRSIDPLGHTVLEFRWPQVPPYARRSLSITANLQMFKAPRAEALSESSRRAWLASERFIETADLAVQALAQSLRRETPIETARAIYDWVLEHLQYAGYIADDHGAIDALNTRQGDCTEYAFLTVALARANQIPARMVGGYEVGQNAVLRAEDYHNWAELYLNGRWQVVDAQKQRWLDLSDRYIAFRLYRDAALNAIGLAHRYAVQGEVVVGL